MSSRAKIAALTTLESRGMLNDKQRMALKVLRNRNKDLFSGVVEPALTMATGAIAEPVSGFVGLAGLPFGVDVAANAVRRTQDALTYQPRTEAGMQGLQTLGETITPIVEPLGKARDFVADKTADTLGPEAGTAVYTALTAAPDLLGLKGARIAGKAGKLGKQYELGDIGPQGVNRQRGAVGGVGGKTDWLKDFDDYEYGNLISHETNTPDFTGEIGRGDVFDGVFGLYGPRGHALINLEDSKHISYIPRSVADSSDLDWDKTKASIKEKYSYLEDDQIEKLANLVIEDNNIDDFADEIDFLPMLDRGEISWELQNLRGKAAVDQGFDAIEMSDENGTSVMIPYGSKAKIIDVNNPDAAQEIAYVMELMSTKKMSLDDAIEKVDVWEDDAIDWLNENIRATK